MTTTDRERAGDARAESLGRRLDPLMGALGIVFGLVVLGETLAQEDTAVGRGLAVAGWTLWLVFIIEFVVRAAMSGSWARYLAKHWWQIIFLVMPFLRFFRALQTFRWLRAGRVFSSAVRAGRSASRQLGDRVLWLAAVTAIVILASSQLLFEYGGFDSYGAALHGAALASITGEPLDAESGFARVAEVILAVYSVVIFATLAASFGAYYLQRDGGGPSGKSPTDDMPSESPASNT